MKNVFILLVVLFFQTTAIGQVINFDKNCRQLVKFDMLGDAVDAHDGEIAHFNGSYYLYGTSYDCGFAWRDSNAPFCGFKVYESKNLRDWSDKGFLFDAQTAVWQRRCDGKTYGCFRPHVIYNEKTKQYVLWINVYDNSVGYRVFTSKTPIGPFAEVAEPRLAVNSDMPAAGLNNGDHDMFVDDDGTAYLAYTDWRTNGSLVIEKLSENYLTGSGECVKFVTENRTEAPGLFKRNGIYYILYSDPNCGYCATGTSYKTASTMLGKWSDGIKISDNSCGGQPSFVSTIKVNAETVYLYGSDLWNNGAKNEALANYYWAPLEFTADGAIKPLKCAETYLVKNNLPSKANSQNAIGAEAYSIKDDIKNDRQYAQSFTAKKSGKLRKISINLFKNKYPDANLIVELYNTGSDGLPIGAPVFSKDLKPEQFGWSPRNVSVQTDIKVSKGKIYSLVLRTNASTGNYGCVTNESVMDGQRLASRQNDQQPFTLLPKGSIKFETSIGR